MNRMGIKPLISKLIDLTNEVALLKRKIRQLEKNSHPPQEFICTTCGTIAKKIEK
tara:strand:+ start:1753 stop:1917 length:165 start_codon:yes stop_codon:yes gene_type:complete